MSIGIGSINIPQHTLGDSLSLYVDQVALTIQEHRGGNGDHTISHLYYRSVTGCNYNLVLAQAHPYFGLFMFNQYRPHNIDHSLIILRPNGTICMWLVYNTKKFTTTALYIDLSTPFCGTIHSSNRCVYYKWSLLHVSYDMAFTGFNM